MFGTVFYKAAGVALGLAALAAAFAPHAAPAQTPPPAAVAAPVVGRPEMWKATGPKGTLYLLGSFHLLKPGSQWEDSRIDDALSAAGHVWFEVTGFDDMAANQGLFFKYGLYAGPELSQHLDADEIKHLDAALARHGLSLAAVQTFKPWAVALVLVQKSLQDTGFDSGQGVDLTLYHKAVAAKKDVAGLETMEMQIGLLANIDGKDGADFLKETLKDDDDGPAKMTQLADAWLMGDEAALTQNAITEMKRDYPELYRKVIADRNAAWLPRIEDMLKSEGTSMVVVGAGHLIGPDGVVARLRADGFKVERVK